MRIKKAKVRAKLCIYSVICIACCAGIIYSGYNILIRVIDGYNTRVQTNEVNEIAEATEIDGGEVIENSEEPPESMYWTYIKMNLLDVNFSELKAKNPDTVGWINVNGTNINYPFVQTTNNDYYLFNNFERAPSVAGWVFADFRNRVDGTDKNMIIYAHGLYDATMFGTLRNILSSGWLNNPNNYVIRTANESELALWQVFSVYRIPTTTDYLRTSFTNEADFNAFANMLKDRSAHDFNTSVNGSDRIITLSTCYSETERVVLHAKLIKRQAK